MTATDDKQGDAAAPRPARARAGAQPNQSLIDGISVLQALAISRDPVGCRELARRVGMETTRVNRLLKTLAYLGIARQTSDRKYRAGAGMTVLAAQSLFASGLLRQSLPALEELRRFGHTVAMGVRWRDNVSYLFHAPPNMPANDALGRIGLYPATSGGIGMALLATVDADEVAELYGEGEIPGYPDLGALNAALDRVRQDGFARLMVKRAPEQHTVAVTVGTTAFAAIGLSGWIPEAAMPELLDALRQAAAKIEQKSEDTAPTGTIHDYRIAV